MANKPARQPREKHLTVCLTTEQRLAVEARAEDLGVKTSPLVWQYLFTRDGKLRPVPPATSPK